MRLALYTVSALAVVVVVLALPVLLPRSEAPPDIHSDETYLSLEHRVVFNGAKEDVISWLSAEETGVLAFTPPTDRIPQVMGTEPVTGDFSQAGDVRRVFLEGDETAVERVLERSNTRFAYQVWGFTAPNARPLEQIYGSFDYVERGPSQTEVIWTYRVAPRAFWARPFVRGFLENDFLPFMQGGLDGSANAYNSQS